MPEKNKGAAWRYIKRQECPHLVALKETTKSEEMQCEVCGLKEDLRICMSCGFVACCESHGSHDTEHFKKTGHPFIKPHNIEYDWLWCYECNAFLK